MKYQDFELTVRSALADALIADSTRVVFVSGPSGSGKSILLEQAVIAARAERFVSGPREVMYSDPLIYSLLQGLSEVVAEIIEQQGVKSVVGRLTRAIERMVESRGRELAHAAGREVVSLVRSKLGPEAGKALTDAIAALREEAGQSLGARLDRAHPEIARETITAFAREVAALSDGRRALVVLDRCERLDDSSLRLLADLADVLPDGVQIWVAAQYDSLCGQFLPRTSASVIDVPPLSAVTIQDLLEQRGISSVSVDEVLASTAGTALDVQAYLGLLEVQGQPGAHDGDLVELDTARRLLLVSEETRRLALRFAALSDPLPEPHLTRLTDADPRRLDTTMHELREVGLLTAHASGQWIHERRRAAILRLAADEDRVSAIGAAATAVWEYIQAGGDERWLGELAGLAGGADDLISEDETLQAVLGLDARELAVMAGLIELTEPSEQAVEAQALLNYVRVRFPTDGHELESLQRLSETGLVVIASNGRAAAAVLRLGGIAGGVALGRIAQTTGVRPIPALASAAVEEVLLPRIGAFTKGHFGVGRPSLRALSYMALGEDDNRWRPPSFHARGQAGPALIARAGFVGRDVFGVFRFASADRRDQALDEVSGLDTEFLGDRVTVSATLSYPMGVVPADRFLNAAARILGRHRGLEFDRGKEPLDTPLSFREFADLRVRTQKALRDLSGATMRGAMELELPLSLHWVANEGEVHVIEVRGGREIASEHVSLSVEALSPGPYQLFHLANELELRADESIANISQSVFRDPRYSPTRFDPVIAEIGHRQAAAAAYNRSQPPTIVRFDASLPQLIRECFFREMADARALASVLPLLGRDDWEVPSTARYIVLTSEPPHPGWMAGARSTLVWAEAPSPSDSDECHVVCQEGTAQPAEFFGAMYSVSDDALRELPGFDSETVLRSGWAISSSGVATFLGHQNADIAFRHADQE